MDELHSAIGSKVNIYDSERDILQHRWRFPSLSLHGVEGGFYNPGDKTVIPAKVIGKFSIRSVPDMEPEKITELVKEHVESEFAKLNSKNILSIECSHAGKPWFATPNHWNYVAAAKAVEKVFNVKPDMTREGGSIPVTLSFQDALNKNVLLLPMGRGDDVCLFVLFTPLHGISVLIIMFFRAPIPSMKSLIVPTTFKVSSCSVPTSTRSLISRLKKSNHGQYFREGE
jgi:Cys-Gly metallodipeptidase DUG1